MKQNNMYTILTSLNICIFLLILLLKKSHAEDYRYEACLRPRNCTHGPNITFPFYIQDLQESYCGYPGFHVNCSETGFPILVLSHSQYVMEDIFYQNRSLRVFNSAFSGLNSTSCFPRIRNTTLPSQFRYVNRSTYLNLFYNCTHPFHGNLSEYRRACDDDDYYWVLGLYDDDENLRDAIETCESNTVVPVERPREFGIANVVEALRRGFVMNWTASDCSECQESGGRCGFNSTTYLFRCFCPDRPHSRSCKPENSREIVILAAENSRKKVILAAGISGGSVILIVLVVSFAIWYRKKKIEGAYILSRGLSFDPSSKSNEGGSFYYGIPIFSYDELEEITNNFDPSKELGDGGFGTVYYGKLRDGREVAIKRLYEHNYKREQQFMNEIKILTCLKHKNLVTLYGCTSRRSRELLLIYEYISNGTVADHLHGNLAKESPLTWPIRMNIAIETASALSYLHKSDIVHRDVKTNNILLDSNFCVKVADFGLSRLFPMDVTHISTAPQGTPGYVDPEYHQCYQLTDKSDVYSFGVVMVELISSMPAVDISRHRHEINLANLAVNRIQSSALDELVDSNLGYNSDSEVTRMTTSVAELAFQCLQLDKDLRPTMDEVLEFLKEIRNGEEFKFEDREYDGDYIVRGKIPPSPETDDVELLKKVRFQSSPVAVTDIWISGTSTTTSSSIG